MPERKYISLNRLADYDDLIKAEIAKGDTNSISSANSYAKSYTDSEIKKITDGSVAVEKAVSAISAISATQDGNGKVISDTYETKSDASAKLTEAKEYSDSIVSTVVRKTGDTMTGYLNFEKTANNVPYKGHIGISNNGNTYITHYSNGILDNYITLNGSSSYVQKPWTIDSGGTGASTSEEARANLNVYSIEEVDNELDGKAPVFHTHTTSDVSGLQDEFDYYNQEIDNKLSSKADANHEHDDYLPLSGGEITGMVSMKDSLQFLNENDVGAYITGGYNSDGVPYLEILGTEGDERTMLISTDVAGYAKSMVGVITGGTGDAYTANVNGISSLSVGTSFVMVPHVVSTNTSPTLNVNNLGVKEIKRRASISTSVSYVADGFRSDWLDANRPIRMEYDGKYWIADIQKPHAYDLQGQVRVPNGGTGLSSVATDSYLVGNGTGNMITKTPDEVRIHIKSAGKNVEGEVFIVDETEEITAGVGAEVFNANGNVATGIYSHAEGIATKALNYSAHAEGLETTASGESSHAEGFYSRASGNYSHVEGHYAHANGEASHAEGYFTYANGLYSHAEGYKTIANDFQHASGKYNEEKPSPATADTQSTANDDAVFLIGYGTSTTRANAFRVTSGGRCRGASSFSATGADFAELFEWADGNPDNEDRRGLFVALDGDKIKLANADDDYIGVISGDQAFIGNTASEEWQGKYLTDVFGTRLYQEIETPAGITTQYILNPDYNPNEKYVMRENRKEWGAVGLLGQVVVIDDGTCVVGGHVKPSSNGIGTASDSGYRVMKRIDENHIKVLVK